MILSLIRKINFSFSTLEFIYFILLKTLGLSYRTHPQDRIQLPLLMLHTAEPIHTFAITNTFPQAQIAVFLLTLLRILHDRWQQRGALFDINVFL